MKILMITPYLPYPLVSGGQIRTFNLLKNLAKNHDITLYSFVKEVVPGDIKQLEKFCSKIEIFKRRKAWSQVNILLSGFSLYPFLVAIYYSRSLKKRIEQELSKNNYNLIHAETFYVMPNIPKTKVPVLLVEQTIEYLVYQRFVESLPVWAAVIKPFLLFDVFKIKWWEKHFWDKAKMLAAMSQDDKEFIQKLNPKLKVEIVANGVDIDFFNKIKKKKPDMPTVLFVGNFKWLPNRDATKYLAEKIWPIIRSQVENAKLWIVGRNPTVEILKLSSNEIKVNDKIQDIRDAYASSSVLLAPIRNGRGTKYKILEAMATKTPIVGTKLATEGINVTNGKEAYIAESSEDLAQKTIEVLKNQKTGEKLANAAYELVLKEYNWKKISKKLDQVYQKVGAS